MAKPTGTAIADQAYEYLYRQIVTCNYLPGQDIGEKQLIESTGLGRTPLREALLALQKEGLVEIFPRKGMRITPFTPKNVNDLYHTRKLIEPTVISEYKALYSKSVLLEYLGKFEEMDAVENLDSFQLDVQFHSYLVGITQNQILIDMYRTLMIQQIRLAMYAALQKVTSYGDALCQHRTIIDALLRENGTDARDAMVLHLNHSLVTSLRAIG